MLGLILEVLNKYFNLFTFTFGPAPEPDIAPFRKSIGLLLVVLFTLKINNILIVFINLYNLSIKFFICYIISCCGDPTRTRTWI